MISSAPRAGQVFAGLTVLAGLALATAALVGVALLLLSGSAGAVRAPAGATGVAALTAAQGLRVEKVAGAGLTDYPMLGTLDDRGRLFVCESSGNNQVSNAQMTAQPNFRVRMLEDLDGDGFYDRSTVFADKLTMPAGAVWLRGSLYVASPPDLLRFEDTSGDGVADRREVVATGWNLSSNAASLHGPFLGPDGWLYLTDGRHGYKIKTREGTVLEGRASRIWRLRPDGSGIEWVSGGGFDNPVEVVFTPAGEMIGTMTYFTDPKNGERDALLHFVEGGVYPKVHPVLSEFKRTGDLMPVMTRFARIAPAGLLLARSAALGARYQGSLFSAHFNSHRIQRHALRREGATFRTDDEDFLTSTDPDFHPTDVMEDADGSLLVIDTGAWFLHGCPISRISKPQIRGAIYRIRRAGEPGGLPAGVAGSFQENDPRGAGLRLASKTPAELARFLTDPRFAVRDRALDLLVQSGSAAVGPLAALRGGSASAAIRCDAVHGLFRIGTAQALEAVRGALDDPDAEVRVAAARAAGMARDRAAIERLMRMVVQDTPPARRQAATALGQIGDPRAVPALLDAATGVTDRFVEHAIIYSLITLRDAAVTSRSLKHADPRVRKAALIALDQMDGSPLRRADIGPFLADADKDLRSTALWVVSRHKDWSGEVLGFLRSRLSGGGHRGRDARGGGGEFPSREEEATREALVSFCGDAAVQKLVAEFLAVAAAPAGRQLLLLETIGRCSLKEFPAAWAERLGGLMLESRDARVRLNAVLLARSRGITSLDEQLAAVAAGRANPAAGHAGPGAPDDDELRVAAVGTLIARRPKLDDSSFRFLLDRLRPETEAALRLAAAQVLGRAAIEDAQLLTLARQGLSQADPLILPSLLEAFRRSRSEPVGAAMVAALMSSSFAGETGGKRLEQLVKNFPPAVQAAARPLVARLAADQNVGIERLRKLEPLLTGGGDALRGRRIFFGRKVACSSCHTIGPEGGNVGPDLTAVGAIRSGHDLLEAIVFPGASFVPGFEVFRVETATEVHAGLILQRTPEAVLLTTGPNGEVRIPRGAIVSMKPSTVSLMPDGLDKSLTEEEFRDLLAFLRAQTSRESASAVPVPAQ